MKLKTLSYNWARPTHKVHLDPSEIVAEHHLYVGVGAKIIKRRVSGRQDKFIPIKIDKPFMVPNSEMEKQGNQIGVSVITVLDHYVWYVCDDEETGTMSRLVVRCDDPCLRIVEPLI